MKKLCGYAFMESLPEPFFLIVKHNKHIFNSKLSLLCIKFDI